MYESPRITKIGTLAEVTQAFNTNQPQDTIFFGQPGGPSVNSNGSSNYVIP